MKDINNRTIEAGNYILYAADDRLKYAIVIRKKDIKSRYSSATRTGLQVASWGGGFATLDVYGRILVVSARNVPVKVADELNDIFDRQMERLKKERKRNGGKKL